MIPMIGKRFGRLTVVCKAESYTRLAKWECDCDCGSRKVIDGSNLRRGLTRSCGCLHKEVASKTVSTHRKSKSKVWIAWRNMRTRCSDISDSRYGGRGIKVCERWQNFQKFYEDMGDPPSEMHSLDRYPNQDGNYEPGNCRWATMKQQLRNNSANRLEAFGGFTLPLVAHCERLGINYKTVHQRLRRGWTVERALTT